VRDRVCVRVSAFYILSHLQLAEACIPADLHFTYCSILQFLELRFRRIYFSLGFGFHSTGLVVVQSQLNMKSWIPASILW